MPCRGGFGFELSFSLEDSIALSEAIVPQRYLKSKSFWIIIVTFLIVLNFLVFRIICCNEWIYYPVHDYQVNILCLDVLHCDMYHGANVT